MQSIKEKKIRTSHRSAIVGGVLLSLFGFGTAFAQGTLYVEGGEVGIGIADPQKLLHIFDDADSAQLRIEDTGANTTQSMFELYNAGQVGFNMFNTVSGENWRFRAANSGFRISLGNSGGTEFELLDTGGLTIGPGPNTVFDLSPTGNLTISGTLSDGSDVNSKQDIDAVDGAQVLAKLAHLPISEWSYKADGADVRHVGPMAQDFYSTFNLGNDETRISPRDMAGVSLAAIKALHAEIAELKEEKAALSERLVAIETSLAGSVGKID